MKHDSHATGSQRQSGRRQARPDLGRPSLFADFDQDSVEDVEPQRIRLLSTLESQRGARARPRGQRRPTGSAHPWLTRALMVLMALGMLVMLLSFMQLLRRPPPALPPVTEVRASTPPPVSAPPTSTERIAALTEAAEIIDTEPPAGGLPQAATVAATASSIVPTQPTQPTHVTTSLAPNDAESANRSLKASTARKAPAVREARAAQDDVALVEAMLAHAGPRKAPPSPTEALRQCGTGTSPETSVCRARICVQHPSLAACHAP